MTLQKLSAISIGIFPLLLAVGIITIPVVADYSNHILAEEAAGQTGRWFWGHTLSGAAFGISILAACSITRYLIKKGQTGSGIASLSLIAVGGALYAFGLGADGVGPLAAAAGGGRALMFFDGSGTMVAGVFFAASALFGIGLISQVIGLNHAGLLKDVMRIIALVAAITFIGVGAIPSGWGLYGVAGAACVIYIPVAVAFWKEAS